MAGSVPDLVKLIGKALCVEELSGERNFVKLARLTGRPQRWHGSQPERDDVLRVAAPL